LGILGMKTSVFAVGVVVLLIGLGIWAFAVYSPVPTQTTTTTTTDAVIPSTSRNIDANGIWSFGMNLQKGSTVTGTATIQSINASAGPVFFYVMNESLFIDWGGCAPCGEPSSAMGSLQAGSFQNSTVSSSGTYTFTYTPPSTGAYYAVFDDEYYGQSAQASLSANAVVPTAVTTNAPYLGGYLPITGAAITLIGLIIAGVGAIMVGKRAAPAAPPATPAPAQ
jgi:hypothetical protein